MILRYGGSNFFCFKEYFEIDLRLNKNCPDNISQGLDSSKVMCIKGANASGKTTALKALSFLAHFVSNSFQNKPESKIEAETFFGNSDAVELFCEFRIMDTDYRYELNIRNDSVDLEALKLLKTDTVLFQRTLNQIESVSPDFKELKSIPSLRANASVISTANQHEMASIEYIHEFFKYGQYSNVGNQGFDEILNYDDVSKFYHDEPDVLEFVVKQLSKFDTGVTNIEIKTIDGIDGEIIYYPLFHYIVDGETKKLRLNVQSSGTKRLYKLLAWCYLMAVRAHILPYGSIMVMDELDLHLHNDILPELIRLFENVEKSQLIFTCQNDGILDSMGKYRSILLNKEDNESYTYRLDELPSDILRNGRPITPHYKKGSIGGVPNIGKQ